MLRLVRPFSPFLVLIAATLVQAASLYVDGRYLRDPQGDKLVLRGANAMTMYWDADGSQALPPLAATNANVVRLFWKVDDSIPLSELEESIQRARDLGMIPMPSLWDATGDWSQLQKCVDWWMRDDVQAMIARHHDYLLINIANEAGTHSVGKQEWEDAYRQIIARFREAGITAPLVVDAAGWGRDESYLLERGPALLASDPEQNLIFSWHPWDVNQPRSRYKTTMDSAVEKGLCLLIGEFSHVGVQYKNPIDWEAIIEEAEAHEIGWLFWCWRGARSYDDHAITSEYTWSTFKHWGWQIAVGHPLSIYNTSVRSPWLGENVNDDPLRFDRWQAFWFSPLDQTEGIPHQADEDADLDGNSNGIEWAFGWSPIEANYDSPLNVVADANGAFALRYPEPEGPAGALQLEASDDLSTWSTVEVGDSAADGEGNRLLLMPREAAGFFRWHVNTDG